jgi:hypothetical protein
MSSHSLLSSAAHHTHCLLKYQVSGGCEQHSNTHSTHARRCVGGGVRRRKGGKGETDGRLDDPCTQPFAPFVDDIDALSCGQPHASALLHTHITLPSPLSVVSKRRRLRLALASPSFHDLYQQLVTDQYGDHLHLCPHPLLCRGRGPRSAPVLPRPSAALLRTVASSTWGLVRHPLHSTPLHSTACAAACVHPLLLLARRSMTLSSRPPPPPSPRPPRLLCRQGRGAGD